MSEAVLSLSERRQLQVEHDEERTAHLSERESLLAPRRSNDELRALAETAAVELADADS
ncbi:MAG: phosphoadenylyl-sulfate reductase, partial [Aeromicrobium sp.]|nr:phosphoadenylyl-sulfate reductase [Aeromicrobium sp.]